MGGPPKGAEPLPAWTLPFCEAYGPSILTLAKTFLWAGLLFALVAAVAEAVAAFKAGGQSQLTTRDAAPGVPAIVDALKGLLEALKGANVWLALVVLGLLLMWMAGNAVPTFCTALPAGDRAGGNPR
jgi:hypothetical protein